MDLDKPFSEDVLKATDLFSETRDSRVENMESSVEVGINLSETDLFQGYNVDSGSELESESLDSIGNKLSSNLDSSNLFQGSDRRVQDGVSKEN